MSLLKTETTTGASFESDDENAGAAVVATPAAATPAPAAALPVAVQKPTALAVAAPAALDVIGGLRNALRVEYNTLESVIANQGNFMSRETNKSMGDQVDFELLSHQDSFVVSPGDDKAPQDCVRYSDDGQTCSDGTSVQEHLNWLRTNGYPKASVKPRVVVVGAIVTTSKPSDLVGQLVQFDLSPMSRTMWNRFSANVAYGMKIGKYTAEQVTKIRANAETAVNGTNTYTLARFSVAV